MKTTNYKGRIGTAIFALSLILGVGIMMSVTTQAQGRNNGEWQRRERDRRIWQERNRDQNRDRRNDRRDDRNRYGNNGDYNNRNQVALNQGYQAGLNTGASDAQRGQSYSPQRSHYYKDARSQQFRNGFVQGYAAGFRQYRGYNNNGGYRTQNNGSGIGAVLGAILGRP